jgi:hypothetical protein
MYGVIFNFYCMKFINLLTSIKEYFFYQTELKLRWIFAENHPYEETSTIMSVCQVIILSTNNKKTTLEYFKIFFLVLKSEVRTKFQCASYSLHNLSRYRIFFCPSILNFILFNFNMLPKENVSVCLQWRGSQRKSLLQTKESREARGSCLEIAMERH